MLCGRYSMVNMITNLYNHTFLLEYERNGAVFVVIANLNHGLLKSLLWCHEFIVKEIDDVFLHKDKQCCNGSSGIFIFYDAFQKSAKNLP